MRASLLTSAIPALALLAAGCSQPESADTTTAAMPSEDAAPAAAPAPEPAAPEVQTAEAEPAPAAATAASSPEDDMMKQAMQAVVLRESAMKLIGWNMGPLGGMMRGNAPFDAAVAEKNASRIAGISPMIPSLFMADVRSYDIDTEALPSIWDNMADFNMKAAALTDAATAAAAAAATGDEAATKMALGAVGQACGSCHDDYRED